MVQTRPGAFSRSKNTFVEMEAYRCDSYSTFVKRAVKKLHLTGKQNKFFSLFKLNGARVLDEPLTVKNVSKPWT